MGRLRHYPCSVPGCPEVAAGTSGRCPAHQRAAWAGRNGTTRRASLGCSEATWNKLRRAALRRDRYCRFCGGPAEEVDHLVPVSWRRPPEHFGRHLDALAALCRACHRVKSQREAALSRAYGSPPAPHIIDQHVATVIGQLQGVARAAL